MYNKQVIRPALTCGLLLLACWLPWLQDPLGRSYTAWELPLETGWHFEAPFVNYGTLCLFLALCFSLVVYTHCRPALQRTAARNAVLCLQSFGTLTSCLLLPRLLIQYLFVDLHMLEQLATHERVLLLVQQQFGYNTGAQLITLDPNGITADTLAGRLPLLVNACAPGILVVILITITAWREFALHMYRMGKHFRLVTALYLLVFSILYTCPVAALGNEALADTALAQGHYSLALRLLNNAITLNPELDALPRYHLERGQALYLLTPDQLTTESLTYLATLYPGQDTFSSTFQATQQLEHTSIPGWQNDEIQSLLIQQVQRLQPLNGSEQEQTRRALAALPLLHQLLLVDPGNVYALYIEGRIQYSLHNYSACEQFMGLLLHASDNAPLQSSAYTYIALSQAGLGNYTDARTLLFLAVRLDPEYRNNTARQALSGLH